MKVTKIKAQKSQRRVNIYLDGKFAFGLPVETLVQAGLAVGQEIGEEDIEILRYKDTESKLYDKALRLISLRPRSEKEIRDYLNKKLLKSRTIVPSGRRNFVGNILVKLKEKKFLDDREFARWWLEQRASFRPRGKFALRVELRQKGISREIIDKMVEQLDELSLAQKAAAKKMRAYKDLGSREFRQKMTAFLARQGFSWETIREVVDHFKKKG